MQDHFLVDEFGNRTPIAQLPTSVIKVLLVEGVTDCVDVSEEDFLERLRIELVARSLDAQ